MLQFEPATTLDIPFMAQVEMRSNPHPWPERNLHTSFSASYQNFLVVADNQVAGYIITQIVGSLRHIIHLCIDKAFQGRGIATEALALLTSICRAQQQNEIWLEVRSSNTVAKDLYLHAGFNEVSVRKNYYPTDNGHEDGLVMVAYID